MENEYDGEHDKQAAIGEAVSLEWRGCRNMSIPRLHAHAVLHTSFRFSLQIFEQKRAHSLILLFWTKELLNIIETSLLWEDRAFQLPVSPYQNYNLYENCTVLGDQIVTNEIRK